MKVFIRIAQFVHLKLKSTNLNLALKAKLNKSINMSCAYCCESNKTWRENGEDKTNYNYEEVWKNHVKFHIPEDERERWEYMEKYNFDLLRNLKK